MLLGEFVRSATASLRAIYPDAEAASVVSLLVEDLLGVDRYRHVVDPSFEIPGDKTPVLESALRRLLAWEPVQYVLGCCEFMGRRFHVDRSVLIPRPETEVLCREALSRLRGDARVLDLCTGSGCIAWTMSLSVPGSDVVGVDISKDALQVARSQFSEGNAPEFFAADVLGEPTGFGRECFDAILSNPPYILPSESAAMRPNVLEYEPSIALFPEGDDPLVFYRALARWASALLAPDGFGLVETNDALAGETADVFRSAGFSGVSFIPDFYEKLRFVLFSKRA